MTHPKPDDVLDVLLEVCAKAAPELDESLLRDCYAIQKTYQFDRDREVPLDATRKLVERFVSDELRSLEERQ